MCGLAGFLTNSSQDTDLKQVASNMADRIAHRGPDDRGAWSDQGAGIAMAHRRLAIVDLGAAGHQPMHSCSRRWVLVYNGEIYNHLDIRRRLESSGVAPAWRGGSDTETLVASIEAWGIEEAIKQSVGMFAIAAWDCKERALWLARDRAGEKPLYYGWQGGTFLFGSELKALRAHPAFNASVDRGALSMLLRQSYVPGPYSIYSGIHKLPPGTLMRIEAGDAEARPVRWWSLFDVAESGGRDPFFGNDYEAIDSLEHILGEAVRGQMVADVPLGALLSGGVDSSLIASLMQANTAQRVRTFTIGFEEHGFDEAVHAKAVANHLGTEHTEMRLSAFDALAHIPQLPEMYDEPFADSSQLPTHLVMKLARQHVTVALSGDAGDELFGGYNRYVLGPKVWNSVGWLPRAIRGSVFRSAGTLPAFVIDRFGTTQSNDKMLKLARVLSAGDVRNIDDLYCGLVQEWPDAERTVIGGHFPQSILDQRDSWPRLSQPVSRMMALDAVTYLPDDILVKVDRASMAVSLEARAPFLDRNVLEFAWRLPLSMKLRGGKGKWILRQLLDRHVPRALIDRPKMGFGVPLDEWLRGPLRGWAEALLSEDRLRHEGYFHPEPIRGAWIRHVRNEGSYGHRLWSVLMFQAWLESNRVSC